LLYSLGGIDVGLRRAGAHRNRNVRFREIGAAVGGQFALFDKLFSSAVAQDDEVSDFASGNALLNIRAA
jgi:hypothetical protein